MKYLVAISLFLLSLSSYGQRVERVNPIYGSDEQANKMIEYISENLQMVIPKGKSLADVNGMMRCKITIDPVGRIADINIINSIQLWLDVVVIEALRAIPPSSSWRSDKSRELKRALVFSFGNTGMPKTIYGYDKDKVNNQIESNIEQQRDKQNKELAKHWSGWEKKNKESLKMDMPLSPDRGKAPVIPLKDQPTTPPVNLPKVSISLE